MDNPFSTFAENHQFFKFLLFWHRSLSKCDQIIPDKGCMNIRTTYYTMCGSCEKVISVWKMVMQYNKRFTNQVNLFLLEIRSLHFYARPSPAHRVWKRSGFVFLIRSLVNRSANHWYWWFSSHKSMSQMSVH